MKIKGVLLLLLLLSCPVLMGQTTIKGCIINIENGQIYVDLTNAQVKAGDHLNVVVKGGYMTHPVTGRRIRKGDDVLGTLEVGSTYPEYSIAQPFKTSLIQKLKVGMTVQVATASAQPLKTTNALPVAATQPIVKQSAMKTTPSQSSVAANPVSSRTIEPANTDKVSVVVAPAVVNDVVNNGHFGGYVADALMEQLLYCDRVRLLDRSVLNAQIDEINLAGDILDANTTIKRGKGIGARYMLQTTMQKPDVANIRTGIPLASVMGAVQGITGTNIGAAYGSNAQIATLKAAVNISVRVVDLQTGEIVFMCSGNGKAQGKAQLSLEYGALGGGELNGGANDFKQTVTGKAIQQAFMRIGRNLNDFFNGNTDKKVMGSVSGSRMNSGDKMYAKGFKLYLGTERLNREGVQMAFTDNPDLYFHYRKAKTKSTWARALPIGGLIIGAGFVGGGIAADDEIITIIAVPVAAIGVVAGVTLAVIGRKQMKKVVNQYNSSLNRRTSYHPQAQLDLAFKNNSIGLCLTF